MAEGVVRRASGEVLLRWSSPRALELAFGPPRDPADLPLWATAYPQPEKESNPTVRVLVDGVELWRASEVSDTGAHQGPATESDHGPFPVPDALRAASLGPHSGPHTRDDLPEGCCSEGAGAPRSATSTRGGLQSAESTPGPGGIVDPAPSPSPRSTPPRIVVPSGIALAELLEQVQRRCPELRGVAAALAANHVAAQVTLVGERRAATYPDALGALLRAMADLIEREMWWCDFSRMNPFCYADP